MSTCEFSEVGGHQLSLQLQQQLNAPAPPPAPISTPTRPQQPVLSQVMINITIRCYFVFISFDDVNMNLFPINIENAHEGHHIKKTTRDYLQSQCTQRMVIIIIILSHYPSRWMKASAFLFHDNLSWAFCFHVTDLQKLSISSLHLFEGLPLGRIPSMGL